MTKTPLLLLTLIILLVFSGCTQTTVKTVEKFEISVTTVQKTTKTQENLSIIYTIEDDEITDYQDPIVDFQLKPLPPLGSKSTDDAYIFYDAYDYDPRAFKDSSGIYQIRWTDDEATFLVSGTARIKMIDNYDVRLRLRLDPFELSNLEQSDLKIKFHNKDSSWSKTYNINIITIEV